MKKDLSRILIVDIEATCWKDGFPPNQMSDIIEVGLSVLFPKSKEIQRGADMIIWPKFSQVSDFCTELTGHTQKYIDDNGQDFSQAIDTLLVGYHSKKFIWASYGEYDKTMFENQCERDRLQYPFSNTHINVKSLFALKQNLTKEVGMAEALKMLDLVGVGRHHNGMDDSYNIARILRYCLWGVIE